MQPFEKMDDYSGLMPSLRAETEPARVLSEWVYNQLTPKSVIDIGCGVGNYITPFLARGCTALGIDGCDSAGEFIPNNFKRVDLRFPLLEELGKFDLTICLEVAEHLPEEHADRLVASVAQVSRGMILFSAAIPGQVGTHHHNCQPPSYWIKKFSAHQIYYGVEMTEELQVLLKSTAFNCVPWFRDSMMVLMQ
jgi:2-polyprenyl-3-methyl-5-hydroxy-6-metoxy-1,4-benzoquinol methylase